MPFKNGRGAGYVFLGTARGREQEEGEASSLRNPDIQEALQRRRRPKKEREGSGLHPPFANPDRMVREQTGQLGDQQEKEVSLTQPSRCQRALGDNTCSFDFLAFL